MSTLELAKRFMHAVGEGDAVTARACLHDDAVIWHNYNNATQTADENMALMLRMKALSKTRVYEVHMMEEVPNGYVQRHTLNITSPDGKNTYSTEALLWAKVVDDKISYVEEFIDPTPIMPLFADTTQQD
ncbi:MAG: ketosteroid isomerase-like protein [Cryomorphaceae bacterium]|jgi:ketosteroid isomerase-like protein